MASNYDKNRWELYNPNLPNEQQPHSFITKRKLDKMEQGIEDANVSLEIGEVKMGDYADASIILDKATKSKKLNIVFPPYGKGDKGSDGKSAYDIWLDAGNIGTEQDFIDYLKGIDGKDGKDGINGEDGAPGPAGESAYQIWLDAGNTGTMQDFLSFCKGEKGDTGSQGEQGESAYDLWKKIPGNENKTITEFMQSLKGDIGPAGSTEFVDF